MTPQITGTTRIIPLLAYPATHVRTPHLFNPELVCRGIDAIVVPWQVAPHALVKIVDALRSCESVIGMIATVPHKAALSSLCDEVVGDGAMLGVVNVVRREPGGRLIGGMLDGAGFLRGMMSEGHALENRRVLLLGAGGAASAIAFTLARQPIASLTIANRNPHKATALASLVARLTGKPVTTGSADPRPHNVIVNATTLGMAEDDPLPVSPASFRPGQLVAEAIMQPPVTRLLIEAQRQSARIHLGEHMMRGQMSLLIDFFFGAATGA